MLYERIRQAGDSRNQRRISRASHSRTGPIRKIEPATTTEPARVRTRARRASIGSAIASARSPSVDAPVRRARRPASRAALGAVVQTIDARDRRERRQHLAHLLVVHRAEDERHAVGSGLTQIGRQRARAGRIVRGIEQDPAVRRRVKRSSRPGHAAVASPARIASRADAQPDAASRSIASSRPQRDGGVGLLVRRPASAIGIAATRARERGDRVSVPDERRAAARAQTARDDRERLGRQRAADDRNPRLDDARLLGRDRRAACGRAAPRDRSRSRRSRRRSGETMLVASSRPPRPTSRTAMSTRASRNSSKAMAVVHSKNVGSAASAPDATRASAARWIARRRRARARPASTSLAVDDEPLFEPLRGAARCSARCGARRRAAPSRPSP